MSVGEVPSLPGGLAVELARQADRCRPTAPRYAVLLERCALDVEEGGLVAGILAPYADRPLATVPGLRLMAAAHRLVLDGRAPELAAFFPTVGGAGEVSWPAFIAALRENEELIRRWVAVPVQTNEPGRSACLFAGLSLLASRTGMPFRLYEIGASAGLNLRADRFCYRVDGSSLGDPASHVVLDDPWIRTPSSIVDSEVRIVERRGCDPDPVVLDAEGRGRLASLVWADDVARFRRTNAALDLAATLPAAVDRASDTASWLESRLQVLPDRCVTVVWHSVVRQYVEPDAWRAIGEVLEEAGSRATLASPVAHLSFEPEVDAGGGYSFFVRLTSWPYGVTETLGTAPPHGAPMVWSESVVT